MDFVVVATGHRPHKLGGYGIEAHQRLVHLAAAALQAIKPTHVVSGMAQGWDLAVAEAAVRLSIPFVAAVPFEDQDRLWPEEARQRYRKLRAEASWTHAAVPDPALLTPPQVAVAMNQRNRWMVDRLDYVPGLVLALWNRTNGGTANTVRYAQSRGHRVDNLWSALQQGDAHA